jgi:hypothetical protein
MTKEDTPTTPKTTLLFITILEHQYVHGLFLTKFICDDLSIAARSFHNLLNMLNLKIYSL